MNLLHKRECPQCGASLAGDEICVACSLEIACDPADRDHDTDVESGLIEPNSARTIGHYQILEMIGRGGMGVVYKAYDEKLDRIVAVKILPLGLHSQPESLARFHREIKIIAQLSHPNIVTAFYADEEEGTHYMVMEYIEGTDLRVLVHEEGALEPAQAIDLLLQTARCLDDVHCHGIIHRDIKPANLRLSEDGQLKLLDLGLARMQSIDASLSSSNDSIGTVDYMAPELTRGLHEADARSDIYSLGCTLFYLLTGRPLYRGETLFQKMRAHQEQPIPKLRDVCPHPVAPRLETVFEKMVHKHPDDRFSSMSEVIQELESLAILTKAAPSHKTSRKINRTPTSDMAIEIVGTVIAILGLVILAAWLWSKGS